MSVQLAPEELGKLQIAMTRGGDGTTAIHILAERSDTLALLVQDQAGLHASLDQAGIAAQGRSISFGLASPDAGSGFGTGGRNGGQGGGRPSAPGGFFADDTESFSDPVISARAPASGLVNITA